VLRKPVLDDVRSVNTGIFGIAACPEIPCLWSSLRTVLVLTGFVTVAFSSTVIFAAVVFLFFIKSYTFPSTLVFIGCGSSIPPVCSHNLGCCASQNTKNLSYFGYGSTPHTGPKNY
jgi:hypothetical protein